ncbi:MAG: DNA gyrase subunit A [Alphaproteobacteria bacterium]|nr:DNA gyrase subunit A [Alphaproteobacteria bacterium]
MRPPTPPTPSDIEPVTIEEEMRRSYLDYAMSVIVSRALPDVRDGLKPVQRRILFAMHEAGYTADKPHRKSARVVGDVMGKYHPHGDTAIYDAMVRMAQDFAMRLRLIDGQGNFGSMDGDPPAAQRYTEARLNDVAESLLADIDQDTVDYRDSYDGSSREPTVLPATFPNLLVNGAGGIAVGMATNIPPHNLGEVIDACCALIAEPGIELERLLALIPGPDFPTGGIIMGRAGIRAAYEGGRGSLTVRGRTHFEEIRKDREAIIVTEVPYQLNKARLVERIAELVRDKRIEGISELRDESNRAGVRVVIELKREAMANIVLNQLFRFTPLESTFGVNAVALDGGRPTTMSLRDMLAAFIAFREIVVTRRIKFLLRKSRDRAHVLLGLAIAVSNLDEIVALIRGSADPAAAREALMARDWPAAPVVALIELVEGADIAAETIRQGTIRLTEVQARAILDLRLQRLTALEQDKIATELGDLATEIQGHLEVLASRARLMGIVRDELVTIRERFADPRRTEIRDEEVAQDIEDLIQREDMVITVSHSGYVKRVPLSAYRAQRRGGKGRSGMTTREEDFVSQVFVANTHAPLLFFSTNGKVYRVKVYILPVGTPQARGKALVNLLPLEEGETISTVMPLPEDEAAWTNLQVMFATAKGHVRRNLMTDFVNVPSNGKIAIKLDDDDRLVGVNLCGADQDVLLAAKGGKCVRFPVKGVRVFKGRSSSGVRGITLGKDDAVISCSILGHSEVSSDVRDLYLRAAIAKRRGEGEATPAPEVATIPPDAMAELERREEFILAVTEGGYGKRTSAYEYRITNRGGQGIINIDTSARNGGVVAAFTVADNDEIVLVTDGGQLIRCPVAGIRIVGRGSQGVRVIEVREGERVISVARLRDTGDAGDDAADVETQ